MAYVPKKDNQTTFEEKRKADALALAELVYDMWQEDKIKKSKERKNKEANDANAK